MALLEQSSLFIWVEAVHLPAKPVHGECSKRETTRSRFRTGIWLTTKHWEHMNRVPVITGVGTDQVKSIYVSRILSYISKSRYLSALASTCDPARVLHALVLNLCTYGVEPSTRFRHCAPHVCKCVWRPQCHGFVIYLYQVVKILIKISWASSNKSIP